MKTLFRKKKAVASGDIPLQITSMADIFTIILVFLLKSFSSGGASISPDLEMTLPDGRSPASMKETLKVDIGKDAIVLDSKEVMKLNNFRPRPTEQMLENGEADALSKAFARERANQPLENKVSELLVLADQRTPYSTLQTIMASAASAGFVDLQLVIVQDED